VIVLPVLAAALLCGPQTAPGELPFFSMGSAVLEQADARRTRPAVLRGPTRLLERLEPLHHVLRIGALELWVPVLTVQPDGEFRTGPELTEMRRYAELLLDLQRLWLEQTGLRGADLLRYRSALEAVGTWLGGITDEGVPEMDGPTQEANRVLASWFQPEVPRAGVDYTPGEFELVIVLAPTRAHYFGLLGAAGLVLDEHRDTFWNPAARRSVNQWLTHESLAVAMSIGPASDDNPALSDDPMNRDELQQQLVHSASHLISNRVILDAPAWFREGLAIHDTVTLAKDDDTLCTGYSQRVSAAWSIPALARLLPYLERDLSPYRDGPAAGYFLHQLRPAKDGAYTIHDIDLGKPAFTVRGPFLDADDRMPDVVFKGPEGVKRGFAEFYRAYTAAFVEFLHQQRVADRTVLAWTIEFVRQRHHALDADELLRTALRMVTMKTLGESAEPSKDLEAAFAVWLGSRK